MRKWALLLAAGMAGGVSSAQAPQLATLKSVAEVRALSHQDAARNYPVDLQATVTYFRGFEKTLFIQGGDYGVFVLANTDLSLQPGDVIRVQGTTADSFNPIVISKGIAFLSHGKLPEPVAVAWPSLIRADYDCRWVKVQGRVTLAEMGLTSARPVTHLVLSMDGGHADIVMDSDDPARLKGLLDAEVEVSAVAGEQFDGKMEQTGVKLHVQSFAFLRILKQSPVDPWSLPFTPMDQVLRLYDVNDLTPRARVEGTLTYYHQSELAVLQDGNESIRILTSQVEPMKLGDRVEAIGEPYVQDNLLTLKMGQVRTLMSGAAVTPQPVTWDDLSSGKYSYNLVSIDGQVEKQVQENARDVYIISTSTGSHLIQVSLRHPFSYIWPLPPDLAPMREIPVGSKVRVTGVAALENGNPYNGPIAFSILLRSADDIAIIASPPWLDVRHLIEVVGILLLVIFAVGVRAWLVERSARHKVTGMAYLEQRRSKILEMINGPEPLAEILERTTELVSASLDGAPSWCQVADGARLGCPPSLASNSMRTIEHPVLSRTGVLLGTVFVATDIRADRQRCENALGMAAGLAKLAIETSHLYSDLVYRSEFDQLTDVQNRFSLERFLDAEIESARHSATVFGLLFVDLDRFKQVNDDYGHRVGDLYLQEVALRMKRQLRPGDMLARLGGDEFAALAANVRGRADVEDIAHRLERCFLEPFSFDGHVLHGSASIGIAMYPENGKTRDGLLSAADASMYVAKHNRIEL